MDETDDGLIRRAIAAAAREAARLGGQMMLPGDVQVAEVDGRRYVVMTNRNGILGVYRVRPDGILKGMKRWPKELDQQFDPMARADDQLPDGESAA